LCCEALPHVFVQEAEVLRQRVVAEALSLLCGEQGHNKVEVGQRLWQAPMWLEAADQIPM
jgi:hypothetical protein